MGEFLEVEVLGKKYLVRTGLRYTTTHEWARSENGRVREGVTDYAQKELKDVVGVELPEVGARVKMGDSIGVLESVKAVADVYAAVSGTVVEVNERLLEEPELVNKDPYGEGWIVVIEPSDPEELNRLLTPEQYAEHIKKEKAGG